MVVREQLYSFDEFWAYIDMVLDGGAVLPEFSVPARDIFPE
jgi:hypothetical protein